MNDEHLKSCDRCCRYIAMGFVVGRGPHPPSRNAMRCVRYILCSVQFIKRVRFNSSVYPAMSPCCTYQIFPL